MIHYHVKNDALSDQEAAQCVYASKSSADEMLSVFVQLGRLAGNNVKQIGQYKYRMAKGQSVNVVELTVCRDACKVTPSVVNGVGGRR